MSGLQSLRMGAEAPFDHGLPDDHRGARGACLLLPAGPERGSDLHHQDHGGAGGVARRHHGRNHEAGDRAAGAHAAGNPAPRLPAKLHARRRLHRSSSTSTARPTPSRWPTPGTMCARASATCAHTLPAGVIGPGFNDEFGDTFGIIYGVTADGFSHRELRDHVEELRSRLLSVPDVSKIELLGVQDEQIFIEFSMPQLAELGIDRAALLAALQAQNAVRPAGLIETDDESISLRVSGSFESEQDIANVNFAVGGRMLRLSRHRHGAARLFRPAAADVPRQRHARHRPCHRHARRRRHPGAGQEHHQGRRDAPRRNCRSASSRSWWPTRR